MKWQVGAGVPERPARGEGTHHALSTPREARSVQTSTRRCGCVPPLPGGARKACGARIRRGAGLSQGSSALCTHPITPACRPANTACGGWEGAGAALGQRPAGPSPNHPQVGLPLRVCDGGVVGQHAHALALGQRAVQEVLHLSGGGQHRGHVAWVLNNAGQGWAGGRPPSWKTHLAGPKPTFSV